MPAGPCPRVGRRRGQRSRAVTEMDAGRAAKPDSATDPDPLLPNPLLRLLQGRQMPTLRAEGLAGSLLGTGFRGAAQMPGAERGRGPARLGQIASRKRRRLACSKHSLKVCAGSSWCGAACAKPHVVPAQLAVVREPAMNPYED